MRRTVALVWMERTNRAQPLLHARANDSAKGTVFVAALLYAAVLARSGVLHHTGALVYEGTPSTRALACLVFELGFPQARLPKLPSHAIGGPMCQMQ